MGFLSRLFGMDEDRRARVPARPTDPTDDQALERYRYMMRTAPPDTLEQAHAEAFAKLTLEQRKKLVAELARTAPENERAAVQATPSDDPQALARVATRAEVRQPGVMERLMGPGTGFGPSLFGSFLAGFVGSMVAQSFFSALGGFGGHDPHASGDESSNHGADADETSYADDTDYGDDGGGFDDGGSFEA
jgi:hypothetical protein